MFYGDGLRGLCKGSAKFDACGTCDRDTGVLDHGCCNAQEFKDCNNQCVMPHVLEQSSADQYDHIPIMFKDASMCTKSRYVTTRKINEDTVWSPDRAREFGDLPEEAGFIWELRPIANEAECHRHL